MPDPDYDAIVAANNAAAQAEVRERTRPGILAALLDADAVMLGDVAVDKIMHGSVQVWPNEILSTGVDYTGGAASFVSVPDSAEISFLSDLDYRVEVSLDDYTPSNYMLLGSHWGNAGNRDWALFLNVTDGKLYYAYTLDGTTEKSPTSTVALGLADGTRKWLRVTDDVDNGASGHTINFYTSDDGEDWDPLGTPVTIAGAGNRFDSTAAFRIGNNNGAHPLAGIVHHAVLKDGIDGDTVLEIDLTGVTVLGTRDPASITAVTGQTVMLSGTNWDWATP